jgi:DNA-binding CsgD family transcriptional regulator
MSARLLDQLTDAQRECLRLVYTRHSSKEIAEIVGVSPSAVDKRIERAVQQLGVTSRVAAARMLVADALDLPSQPPPGAVEADGSWWLVRRLLGLGPTTGSEMDGRNPLTRSQRLGVIVALVFLISMSSMALLNLGQTLSSLAVSARDAPRR